MQFNGRMKAVVTGLGWTPKFILSAYMDERLYEIEYDSTFDNSTALYSYRNTVDNETYTLVDGQFGLPHLIYSGINSLDKQDFFKRHMAKAAEAVRKELDDLERALLTITEV